MICPRCRQSYPPGTTRCPTCDVTLLTDEGTISDSGPASQPRSGSVSLMGPHSALQPGHVLSNRYEIVELLGEGGMGAVYKAWDRELDKVVAFKTIRPELAEQPEIVRRFKQELILARQVTHKNVNRIFDLGESDRLKFITMEFVEGDNLKKLLRERGKLPPEETVAIVIQVCRALEAAHAEGVVHRDLKPHNIMVDKQGRVVVMDFGLAHSMQLTGFTQTGALLGTPEYMSPEQAKGEKVDQRSDLFALGIVFYELLTGEVPFKADTPYGTLVKRTREKSTPPSKLNPAVSSAINNVVVKALQIDPRLRYQNAREMLQDLELQRRPHIPSAISLLPSRVRSMGSPRRVVAGLVVLLLAVAATVFWMSRSTPSGMSTKGEPISIAVLPFYNASGDQKLDWLSSGLSDMLTTDIGQTEPFRTVSADRLHQTLKDLHISSGSSFDSTTLGRVAEFTNAEVLVWGKYAKLGQQIRIDATLQDLKQQRTTSVKAQAPSEEELLDAVGQLARAIQDELALRADIERKPFEPSTESIEALRYYNEGVELTRQGNYMEAAKKLEASVEQDEEFALAYAKLSQVYATLGYDQRAADYSRKAADSSGDLPPAEKFRILANQAQIAHNHEKAIEAYENLAEISPGDPNVYFSLGEAYEEAGQFEQARQAYAKVLERDPKYVEALYAAGRVEIRRGAPEESLDHLNRALSLAIQLDNQEGKAKILQAIGIAYRIMNKPREALRYYEESLAIKREINDRGGIAASLNEIAIIQELLGERGAALEKHREALKIHREIGDMRGEANTLTNLGMFHTDRGDYESALAHFKEALQIHLQQGAEGPQAATLNNIANVYFYEGQYDDARTYYQRSLQLREKLNIPGETAQTLFNLGETLSKVGEYDKALSHYLRALELWRNAGNKREVAAASYGLGRLFEYQGRYGAALSARKEAFETFQQLEEKSFWYAEIQSSYAHALSLMGRYQEAQKMLMQSLELARSLENDALIAQILNFQGENSFYQGDFATARRLFGQAVQVASKTKDAHLLLVAKGNVAKVDVKQGHNQRALRTLRELRQEAKGLRLKYLSIDCSLYLAEALLNTKNYQPARRELESALQESENLNLRALLARSHYLLAVALQALDQEKKARQHHQQASRLLQEMLQEAGTDTLGKREDLRPITAAQEQISSVYAPDGAPPVYPLVLRACFS